MEKNHYTAEEAMEILGMAKTSFYEAVKKGEIPTIPEKGRKRDKKFPKDAIQAHLRMLQRGEKTQLTFGRMTNAEVWVGVEYEKKLYGEEDSISYLKALEWLDRNNEIFMSAREGDELAATVTLMPLEESIIHSLIADKIREKNIPLWAIRRWTDPEISVYIPTISIFPSGDAKKDKERGRYIIVQTIKWAITLEKLYSIKKWYAIGATEEGIRLLDGLGFQRIEGTRKGYVITDLKEATKAVQKLLKQAEEEGSSLFNPTLNTIEV